MLTKKQIKEIREHLEKSQNPLFFFDNDLDGFCSFLLLQRYLGRGKGVPVKTFPSLSPDYFRKINELNPDYIFILDKPFVSKEFFDKVEQVNLPVVWIDHHSIDKKELPKFVNYYNPLFNKKKTCEPVTALCYQLTNKKEDLWVAVIGCISDTYLPKFYDEFVKKYPDLAIDSKSAYDVFYKSGIGKISNILDFALKDKTSEVVNMIRFLIKVETPYDILEFNSKTKHIHERFNNIEKKYKKIIEKALEVETLDRLLFFQYSGDMSISSELSNELSYRFPNKIVVVAYVSGSKANVSARGKSVRNIILKAIEGLEGATGGGHEDAAGAKVNIGDIEIFKKRLFEIVK